MQDAPDSSPRPNDDDDDDDDEDEDTIGSLPRLSKANRASTSSTSSLGDLPLGKGKRKASLRKGGTIVHVPARPGLGEQQVQDLNEIFGLFDDGNGRVSAAEVLKAVEDAKLDKENPEVWRMLAGLRTHGDIDFEEFLSLVTDPLGDSHSKVGASRMLASLTGQDTASENSSFGLAALMRIVEELGLEIDEEALKDMLEKAGADADGNLDFDGFYSVLQGPEAS